MDLNKLILESFNKALELNGQNIKISDKDKNIKANTKGIVKAERVQNQDSTYFISVGDVYKITTLEKTEIGDLISFKNKQYKVESIDNTSPLYVSYCKYNGIDIVYNIALAESSTIINKDNTYQIVVTATENSVTIENPTIIYSSSSDTIATVSPSGLVTGVSEGECSITCNYQGVSATLTVNVIVQSQAITYGITANTIELANEEIYELRKYNTVTFKGYKKTGNVIDTNVTLHFKEFGVPSGVKKIEQTSGAEPTLKLQNTGGFLDYNYPITLLDELEVELLKVYVRYVN